MAKRPRCAVCRKRFTPAATTGARQKTCGPGCRLVRRRKQARVRPACTHVEHDRAHVGDTCPQCSHGRLYRLREPERIVRITGQPPLAARTWELDRLRCSGCGGVFTAPAPAEAQGPKYDERAAAIMALLRYRVGTPHRNRPIVDVS